MSQTTESVHEEILTSRRFNRSRPPWSILSLHPSNVGCNVPVRENPAKVLTFLNWFINAGGNYPTTDFWTLRWVSIFKQQWWCSLTLYVLEVFVEDLMRLGLYEVVRATCFGISISIPTFYAILEMYCPASRTFFTPVGELGMALHETWEISNLLSTFRVLKS